MPAAMMFMHDAIVRKRKTTIKTTATTMLINGEDKDKCDTSSICEINKQKLTLSCIYYVTTTRILQTTTRQLQCRQNTETMIIFE